MDNHPLLILRKLQNSEVMSRPIFFSEIILKRKVVNMLCKVVSIFIRFDFNYFRKIVMYVYELK